MSDTRAFEIRNVFNRLTVAKIADQIHSVYPSFQNELFIRDVMHGFESLSFSERNKAIYRQLVHYLPDDFVTSATILTDSLGDKIESELLEGYDGFYVMPLAHYIAHHGLDHFDLSMKALLEMTMRFTAEWAIRPFLEYHEDQTLAFLRSIASQPNPHARRLVSEGSRPRLPWGSRLKKYIQDPGPVLNLLESLKNEPTRLVQRSIANSLNDIGKDHPERVIEFLRGWKEQNVRDIDWIISHATRSLIKAAHPLALELIGYPAQSNFNLSVSLHTPRITLGEALEFSLIIEAYEDQNLLIDYLIGFKKASGTISPKVFKLTTKKLIKGQTITLIKRHPIKPATTRVHYTGEHTLQFQINGLLIEPIFLFHLECNL